MVTGLFRDSQVHIATNTDLSGLDKEIVDRADIKGEIEIPRFDRQTQAEPDKPEIWEIEVMTDTKLIDIENLEFQVKKLKDANFNLEKEVSHLHDMESEMSERYSNSKSNQKLVSYSMYKYT